MRKLIKNILNEETSVKPTKTELKVLRYFTKKGFKPGDLGVLETLSKMGKDFEVVIKLYSVFNNNYEEGSDYKDLASGKIEIDRTNVVPSEEAIHKIILFKQFGGNISNIKTETFYDGGISDYYVPGGGYYSIGTEEVVQEYAEEQILDRLEGDPESWIGPDNMGEYFIMTDHEIAEYADTEANAMVYEEGWDTADIITHSDSEEEYYLLKSKYDDLIDDAEGRAEAGKLEEEWEKKEAELIVRMKKEAFNNFYDSIEEKLERDAYDYLTREVGYDHNDIENVGSYDWKEAAKELVDNWGIGEVLDPYEQTSYDAKGLDGKWYVFYLYDEA